MVPMNGSNPRFAAAVNDADEMSATSHSCQIDGDAFRTQKSNLEIRSLSPDEQFIHDFNNFKKSSAPSRFLFYRNNSWVDFPRQAFDDMSDGFISGKSVLELSINGNNYVFDFIRMIQINVSTKAHNSIAWIDVNGNCFFPKKFVQQQEEADADECSDETSGINFEGVVRLKEEEKFYKVVEKLFLSGMRRGTSVGYSNNSTTVVTSVYKCSYNSSESLNLRLKVFHMMVGMTKAARGDANVRFGWFGASSEGVAGVIKHGFGKTNDGALGLEAHGVGVHLSPPHLPYSSSFLSEADYEGGEKHMVLCRVIMGNSEKVEAGSVQYHPSSQEFDSSVDDLINPKWYIVWSTHMNTHIIPEYIVSFKSSPQHQGKLHASVNPVQRRSLMAAGLSFQKLLSEMGKSLPSSRMQALQLLYNKHKGCKMSKEIFIRHLRSMAGDKLLAFTIKKIRGY